MYNILITPNNSGPPKDNLTLRTDVREQVS